MPRRIIYAVLQLLFLSSFSQTITTDEWKQFVPSSLLPSNIQCSRSNNNLDLIQYHDRFYFIFRTAPTHFASKKTKLFMISSPDLKQWKYETEFFVAADMREPRFVVFKDTLRLYFFEGGANMFHFQPKHIWTSALTDTGWSEKVKTNLDGFVGWRLREHDNRLYLSAYYGIDLYSSDHHANLRLFTSEDGISFKPLSERPQVTTRGAEEAEFIFDKDGNLWSLVRLEGSGSYLCFASKDSLDKWSYKFSKKKYDSSLFLEQDDNIYLVSRRHLKGDATQSEFPDDKERRRNMIRYWFSKKVTALFRINKQTKEIEHIMDFPSTGDTAFPAATRKNDTTYYLFNYSSNIHKRKKVWIGGQLGKTYIYQTELHFR
jgi:hypothetical protein